MTNDVKDTIDRWLKTAIDSLKKKYRQMGLKASGKWEKELEGDITELNNGGVRITILGAKHTWYMVNGRRPTAESKRGRLYGILLQWIKDKGIVVDNPKRFAYFAARKIDEQGITVPNRYNDGTLLDELERQTKELTEQLKETYSARITSDVIKAFKNGN